jgi:hypothetical protein
VPQGTDILALLSQQPDELRALRSDALFPLILQSSVGDVAGAEY